MVMSRICKKAFKSWKSLDEDLVLCSSTVENLFEIPEGVAIITVNLSTKKTKESYEIKQENSINCFLHYNNSWNSVILLLQAERRLTEAFRLGFEKTLYLSIEY